MGQLRHVANLLRAGDLLDLRFAMLQQVLRGREHRDASINVCPLHFLVARFNAIQCFNTIQGPLVADLYLFVEGDACR